MYLLTTVVIFQTPDKILNQCQNLANFNTTDPVSLKKMADTLTHVQQSTVGHPIPLFSSVEGHCSHCFQYLFLPSS